jgi:hypothetical protein
VGQFKEGTGLRLIGRAPKGHIWRMQSKYDPFDLEISVSPHGGIAEWQWTLSIGDGAPIEIGVVKGSRMDGIRAAREERMRLIGRAVEATR